MRHFLVFIDMIFTNNLHFFEGKYYSKNHNLKLHVLLFISSLDIVVIY